MTQYVIFVGLVLLIIRFTVMVPHELFFFVDIIRSFPASYYTYYAYTPVLPHLSCTANRCRVNANPKPLHLYSPKIQYDSYVVLVRYIVQGKKTRCVPFLLPCVNISYEYHSQIVLYFGAVKNTGFGFTLHRTGTLAVV